MNEYSSLSQQLLIGEALKCAAHNVPKQEAFVFEEKRLTYEETLKKASSAAGWILSQGIRKGDHIACLFKNNLEFIDVYFGASLSGTVLVPVNFRLVPNELIFIINQSEARMLFIEAEYVEMIHSISEQLPMVEHYIVNGTASFRKAGFPTIKLVWRRSFLWTSGMMTPMLSSIPQARRGSRRELS